MDEPTPTTPTPALPPRRAAVAGAVLGALALAGTVVGVGAIAGAQDTPETDPVDETDGDNTETDPADLDADELGDADVDGAEAEWLIDDEEWAAFDECMAGQLGDLWIEPDVVGLDGDLDELSEAELLELEEPMAFDEAAEQAFEDAEEACSDQLPEDVRAEFEAWEAFDECLDDQLAGIAAFEGDTTIVHVEGPDGFQAIEFGEAPGTVTITGNADGIEVATDGDVIVLDEAALDAEWEAVDDAHEACEDLLPDEVFSEDEWFDED